MAYEGQVITYGGAKFVIKKATNSYDLGIRLKNKSYEVGDVAYSAALTSTQKLVCVKAGTTSTTDLTLSSSNEGSLTTDGTVVWAIDSLADGINSAQHKNGIWRGADLTEYYNSGLMTTNISNGIFVNMYIGDYVTKSISLAAKTYTNKSGTSVTRSAESFSNVDWLLSGFDYHLHSGSSETTKHHVVMMPGTTLSKNISMNPSDITDGGYQGSDMWKQFMPIYVTAIESAFSSSHVLSHYEILSSAVTASAASAAGAGLTGSATSWSWVNVKVNIPNEPMVYGTTVWSSSALDVGDCCNQLPLFVLDYRSDNQFWLRSVASSSRFAFRGDNGNASYHEASYSTASGGICPYFLLA